MTATAAIEQVLQCCPDSDLDHCHGAVVLHADGTWECIEPDCATPHEGHAGVVRCAEVTPACRCA